MSDGRIRVALVGFGYAGRTFHAPLLGAEPRFHLTVVGSSRPADVRAVLPDVRVVSPDAACTDGAADLVVIATPNDIHAALAAVALEAGKHVVVDKPMALDLPQARALAALAEARNRVLAVFQNRRWDSDFLSVRDAVESGAIGSVVAVESRIDRWRPAVRDRWREGTGPGAGLLLDLGPHLVDQMLVLFGMPDAVSAWIGRQRPGAVADDAFQIGLDWGDRRALLSASMLMGGGTPRWLVQGTRGTLLKQRIDGQEEQLKAGCAPGCAGWGVDTDPVHILTGDETDAHAPAVGDQRQFYARLAACLLDGAPNPVPPREALGVMAVLDAARRSAEQGIVVAPEAP